MLILVQQLFLLCILAIMSFQPHNVAAQQETIDVNVYDDRYFIYTPREMLSFDIKGYLTSNIPELAPYAETIAHWSAYSTVSPKILITLMEYQTGIVSKSKRGESLNLDKPFGMLSSKHGFQEQIIDVSEILSNNYYLLDSVKMNNTGRIQSTGRLVMANTLKGADALSAEQQTETFANMYNRLFATEILRQRNIQQDNTLLQGESTPGEIAPDGYTRLQLPFPVGEVWAGGGAHGDTGGGKIFSALDFWESYASWGGDTSDFWVTASTGGTVVQHSSCSVSVIGTDGWTTGYYHLDNVQVASNQTVQQNQKLANYANNPDRALCQGGSSTGPHLHFSVTKDGKRYHLDGLQLSTITVHTGRFNYDTDCNYSWYELSDGTKVCPNYRELLNEGIPSPVPLSNNHTIFPYLLLLLNK